MPRKGAYKQFKMSAAMHERLSAIARRDGVSMYAAFQRLLEMDSMANPVVDMSHNADELVAEWNRLVPGGTGKVEHAMRLLADWQGDSVMAMAYLRDRARALAGKGGRKTIAYIATNDQENEWQVRRFNGQPTVLAADAPKQADADKRPIWHVDRGMRPVRHELLPQEVLDAIDERTRETDQVHNWDSLNFLETIGKTDPRVATVVARLREIGALPAEGKRSLSDGRN